MKAFTLPSRTASTPEADEVEARRAVLRGAFAVGCSVLVPASLAGCGRQEPETPDAAAPGAMDGSAPAPGSDAEAPAPDAGGAQPGTAPQGGATPAKVSQASVQYQDQPKGEQKCANCIQFIQPNACKVVEGEISPEGWCAIWVGQT